MSSDNNTIDANAIAKAVWDAPVVSNTGTSAPSGAWTTQTTDTITLEESGASSSFGHGLYDEIAQAADEQPLTEKLEETLGHFQDFEAQMIHTKEVLDKATKKVWDEFQKLRTRLQHAGNLVQEARRIRDPEERFEKDAVGLAHLEKIQRRLASLVDPLQGVANKLQDRIGYGEHLRVSLAALTSGVREDLIDAEDDVALPDLDEEWEIYKATRILEESDDG